MWQLCNLRLYCILKKKKKKKSINSLTRTLKSILAGCASVNVHLGMSYDLFLYLITIPFLFSSECKLIAINHLFFTLDNPMGKQIRQSGQVILSLNENTFLCEGVGSYCLNQLPI